MRMSSQRLIFAIAFAFAFNVFIAIVLVPSRVAFAMDLGVAKMLSSALRVDTVPHRTRRAQLRGLFELPRGPSPAVELRSGPETGLARSVHDPP